VGKGKYMKYFLLLGRILFSLIFIFSGVHHFSPAIIDYASSQGVPMATFLVPLSGIIAILGGLSIALGFKAKWGAWLIIIFLVPVTFSMHKFWTITDPQASMVQMIMFMKNISMLGGALIISYFAAGPVSVDSWLRRKHNNHY
jgi:putative oxidoreductase